MFLRYVLDTLPLSDAKVAASCFTPRSPCPTTSATPKSAFDQPSKWLEAENRLIKLAGPFRSGTRTATAPNRQQRMICKVVGIITFIDRTVFLDVVVNPMFEPDESGTPFPDLRFALELGRVPSWGISQFAYWIKSFCIFNPRDGPDRYTGIWTRWMPEGISGQQ
ncbi:hypothetical protein P153DRAFT_370526 [Dothidotthia symphoricarpi CBS 119687]|uniref:Uncharacterized protein n=1 Tax=Dothidotthia symphoricarpi CBS 119687 TaxID=1392245 RepID=A0A6A6A383_9PLEO|nr:uncharacterized protein P153DRAFT_370526 [Dothidotthia symphoricarpi CBS 119687]KAF2125218.1 hypothetical protein P153DRAFT_370526 [Dothidotthia symphoricarpi CBS 119687]